MAVRSANCFHCVLFATKYLRSHLIYLSFSRSLRLPTMSTPINIKSVAASTSPVTSSIHDHFRNRGNSSTDIRQPKVLHPLENEGLRLLILENISQDAVATFRGQGYHVDHYSKAMSENELVEKIGSYHGIGIRSKTKITQRVLKAASKVFSSSPSFCCQANSMSVARHWMLLYRHQSSRPLSCC